MSRITAPEGDVTIADAPKLRALVLEREIVMAASGELHAGYFAGNPDVAEFAHDQAAQLEGQLAHGEGAPRRLPGERQLFHRCWL